MHRFTRLPRSRSWRAGAANLKQGRARVRPAFLRAQDHLTGSDEHHTRAAARAGATAAHLDGLGDWWMTHDPARSARTHACGVLGIADLTLPSRIPTSAVEAVSVRRSCRADTWTCSSLAHRGADLPRSAFALREGDGLGSRWACGGVGEFFAVWFSGGCSGEDVADDARDL